MEIREPAGSDFLLRYFYALCKIAAKGPAMRVIFWLRRTLVRYVGGHNWLLILPISLSCILSLIARPVHTLHTLFT